MPKLRLANAEKLCELQTQGLGVASAQGLGARRGDQSGHSCLREVRGRPLCQRLSCLRYGGGWLVEALSSETGFRARPMDSRGGWRRGGRRPGHSRALTAVILQRLHVMEHPEARPRSMSFPSSSPRHKAHCYCLLLWLNKETKGKRELEETVHHRHKPISEKRATEDRIQMTGRSNEQELPFRNWTFGKTHRVRKDVYK